MKTEFTYKIHSIVDANHWNENLKKSNYANFFQTYEFLQLKASQGERFPLFVEIFNKSNEIVGQLGLIIRKSSKAYSSENMEKFVNIFSGLGHRGVWVGGPIIHSTNTEDRILILEQIFEALEKISKENNLSILDGYSSPQDIQIDKNFLSNFKSNGFDIEDYFTYATTLDSDLDSVWKNVQRKMRGDVSRAQRRNVVIKELENYEQINDIIELSQQWGKTKGIGEHTHDDIIKKAVWNCIQSGTLRTFLAYSDNELISSHSLGLFNGIAIYYGVSSSYSKPSSLGGPLLVWTTIEWAKKHGYKIYDFSGGKSPPKSQNPKDLENYKEKWDSLLTYKKKWGGETFPYFHFVKVRKKKTYKLFRAISKPDYIIRNYRKKQFRKPVK